MFPDFTPKQIASFWNRVDRTADADCWEWQGKRIAKGYGKFIHQQNNVIREFLTHRMAYFLTYGSIPKGKIICHKCDNPACCNPSHLYAGTYSQNNFDTCRRGGKKGKGWNAVRCSGDSHWSHRRPDAVTRGSKVGGSKLTEADVVEIRRRYSSGEKVKALSAEFGIHEMSVYPILQRKTWRHVP